MEILDDTNVIAQRDPKHALEMASNEWQQLELDLTVGNAVSVMPIVTKVIVAGMGGSALAAGMAVDWLKLSIPFEVLRDYTLPAYADEQTLVIASSYSGNTEETLSVLQQAMSLKAPVAVLAGGGKLLEIARSEHLPYVELPAELRTAIRMALMANLNGLLQLLVTFGVVELSRFDEFKAIAPWLHEQTQSWLPDVIGVDNAAKQYAWHAAGKTPVIYASGLFASLAYKWKISFNENAKNVAFCNEYSEFNHNEFIGWTSHPVEKPFAVFDLRSSLDHPQIQKRFIISDKLLSGKRPKATVIDLQGDTVLKQMFWGAVLADFVTIYLAILNGVDSTDMELIERLKNELT